MTTAAMANGTINSPANDPYVITVGAMKDMGTAERGDDPIASYSSKGPTAIDHVVKPDLLAPGNRIVSTSTSGATLMRQAVEPVAVPFSYYVATSSTLNSPAYFRLSGTSMAAPMVSGAAALLIQKEPGLAPDAVKARLIKTATKAFPSFSVAVEPSTGVAYTSQCDIFTVGAGYLDIWAALNSVETVSGPALSPTAVSDPATSTVSVVNTTAPDGTSAAWGSRSACGTSAAWGSAANISPGTQPDISGGE